MLTGLTTLRRTNWKRSVRRLAPSWSPPPRAQVVLSFHEDSGRGRWEVGYILYNLLIQAVSLGIGYRAHLLNEEERTSVASLNLGGKAAAVFSLS